MGVLDNVAIGMTAETTITVSPEMTVGHFVAGMPQVYATPMMILWDGNRKISDGTHRRGIVNVVVFEKRYGVKPLAMSPG